MSLIEDSGGIRYSSARPGAEFTASYAPISEPYLAASGSIEHWLTERYCLYASAPDGSLWHGLKVQGPPPLLHFARRIDVVVWNAERVL
jgi:hypothetical protein